MPRSYSSRIPPPNRRAPSCVVHALSLYLFYSILLRHRGDPVHRVPPPLGPLVYLFLPSGRPRSPTEIALPVISRNPSRHADISSSLSSVNALHIFKCFSSGTLHLCVPPPPQISIMYLCPLPPAYTCGGCIISAFGLGLRFLPYFLDYLSSNLVLARSSVTSFHVALSTTAGDISLRILCAFYYHFNFS